MNSLAPFLLLLCVSALCITSTSGSYNHGHPLLKTASKGMPQLHSIHKRQSDSNSAAACTTALVTSQCTSGYNQDYAYIAARCNLTDLAESFQLICQRNSMGDFCGTFFDLISRQAFLDACGNSSAATCVPGCRDFISTTRSQMGCCVNIFNGTVNFDDDDENVFSSSLWSLCGVELVAEQCAASAFGLPEVDPTCTSADLQENLYSRILCRTEYLESLLNALQATEGCAANLGEDFSLADISTCAVNEQGRFCELEGDLRTESRAASDNCDDTSECDPLCIDTLNSTAISAGCCFIEAFNTSSSPPDWLSAEFWQRCGLTSPGFCARRFDDSNTRIGEEGNGARTEGNGARTEGNGARTEGNGARTDTTSNASALKAAEKTIGSAIIVTVLLFSMLALQ